MDLKKNGIMPVCLFAFSLLLTGCASTTSSSTNIMVAPVSPDYKLEVTLARLNEILSNMELTDEQRARFHYDRGVRYDSVGLKILAKIDFHQALKLQPNLVDAYNFLGIYYTQDGEYESAYEAFDDVLELSSEYDYAYLNRGIALYYGERYKLALDDMQSFYTLNPEDGYRALWLYITQEKIDSKKALEQLQTQRLLLKPDQWSGVLADYYLGKLDDEDVIALAEQNLTRPNEYAERLCEAYFYMAKVAQAKGEDNKAANYFKLTLATNIYDFVEHRYASLELKKYASAYKAEQLSKQNHQDGHQDNS